MTPEFVADKIAKAILSGKSQHVILPTSLNPVSGARGWPHWLHELINDTTKAVTINQIATAKGN